MRRLLVILLSLPLLGLAAPPSDVVRYTLAPEMTDGTITALRVEVRFPADASGTTGFGWGQGWGGERALWQWVRDLDITGAVTVEQDAPGHWRIKAVPGADLAVTYRIVSAYDQDPTVENSAQPSPVIRPGWFYAVGNALFGRPDKSSETPATFDWAGEANGIAFTSDLEHLAGSTRVASRPGTVADVLESVVIGGRDLRIFPANDGSGVRVAVVGKYAFTPEDLDSLARRIIAVERDFWDADRRQPFLITVGPIIGSPTQMGFSGTGRSDAFALWLDQRTPIERLKWLLAHEYFHTWNPGQLGTVSGDVRTRQADYWFSEGVTDYYARALLVRFGLITPQEFADHWNEMLLAYAGSPARNMSGTEAADAFWSDEAGGQLPYQRGAILAAIWNARLLASSDGQANLDAVMKAQMVAARSSEENAVTLFRALAQARGLDTADDVERYLTRGETIVLPPDLFGPCATVVSERRPSFSRGFDPEATATADNIATGVDPASPAHAAGLRDGMRILERTQGRQGDSLVPYALLIEDQGQQRTIRYLPQGRDQVTVQQVRLLPTAGSHCRGSLGGLGLQRDT